ncbi:sigma-70 family RNA polymerase sigma factor [Sorangium sp. So ce233]|uniref:sigma-70 family RNA polymerase sigma factor n=1 Tax=Sorangium sp. So ce233 TaxID=3133290 RepID=UPI003F607AE9
MKRPRKGAPRPPAAYYPPALATVEAIVAERRLVVATLIASGVPKRDRADVVQGVVLGAWRSIKRGMYRPDASENARQAFRKWLRGIAWKQASHYRERAYVRYEVLSSQPFGLLREVVGPSLEAQVDAREALGVLAELKPWQREILLATDEPEPLAAYAERRGMNPSTAATRLRLAREAFALRLAPKEDL